MHEINQMLLEMASGNFYYRLERSDKNDYLEAISLSLNMLAEEIQEAMVHQGYVNSNNIIVDTIQMCFVLNKDEVVVMANQQACHLLSVLPSDIIGKSFSIFLTENSEISWQNIWNSSIGQTSFEMSVTLKFKSKAGLIIPKVCHISRCCDKNNEFNKTFISVIHHSIRQDYLDSDIKGTITQLAQQQKITSSFVSNTPKKTKIRLSFEDIHKIREGHSIIMNNLEMSFPSLKTFALQLGTNEFKLKYGFKQLYGTTVFNFIKQERLRKSKMMVQYSTQSLKSIAHMTGFKSFAHFSRTFKAQYGCTPSELRKKS
jgi:AraC-like DNA-binding protein